MIISIIVAVAENNVIGKNNMLPWHLPADMKYFKDKTMGHCVVTGRKNFESIPDKYRPLSGRINIVITRNNDFSYPSAVVVHSLDEAITEARSRGESELFIIGGGEIFRQALHIADKVYITRIHQSFDGDIFFPELNAEEWRETKRKDCLPDEKNRYSYSYIEMEKV